MALSVKEKAVLDYIKGHPECIKQEVVNALTEAGILSRAPILNTIKELDRQGMIKVRKKKANSQTHYLRINDDSILLSVINETEEIKKAFFTLLDRVGRMWKIFNSERRSYEDWWDQGLVDVEVALEILFRHFVSIYMLHALFTWPKKVNSKDSLHRLNEIVFSNIQEIQTKFFESNPEKGMTKGNIVSDSWVLNSKKLKRVNDDFKFFEIIGLDKEADSLLDLLWSAGSGFLPYLVLEGIHAFMPGEFPRKRMILKIADEIKDDWRRMLKNKNYSDLIESRN